MDTMNTMMMAKEIKQLTCLRCGFKWYPRKPEPPPSRCANPECRSPYWNKPRRKK